MRWDQVPEEKKALIIERRNRGESFSKIGRDLSIDRRVVAKIFREEKERQSGRAVIRPGALTELFHEHREAMETVATGLLQLTASPLLRGSLLPREPNIEDALYPRNPKLPGLAKFLKTWLLPVMGKEKEKADLELYRAVEQRLAQRRLDAAFEGLLEHISGLKDQIAKWKEIAAGYKETWEQLEEQAIGSGVSPDQVEVSINRAIEGLPAFTGEETLPRPKKTKPTDSVGQFADILLQRPDSRRLLQVFSQKLGELNAVYQELEEMLGPPRLDNALVVGHCRYCPVP
jgi:hypothetical protein